MINEIFFFFLLIEFLEAYIAKWCWAFERGKKIDIEVIMHEIESLEKFMG